MLCFVYLYRKGRLTRCNIFCNLQCNFALGKCEITKYMFPSQFATELLTYQTFVTNLHLLRVELRCKFQEFQRETETNLQHLKFLKEHLHNRIRNRLRLIECVWQLQ